MDPADSTDEEEEEETSEEEEEEDSAEAVFDALAAAAEARRAMEDTDRTGRDEAAEDVLPEDFLVRRFEAAVGRDMEEEEGSSGGKKQRL